MNYLKLILIYSLTIWFAYVSNGFEYIEHVCKSSGKKEIILFQQKAKCCNIKTIEPVKKIEEKQKNCCKKEKHFQKSFSSEIKSSKCCVNNAKFLKVLPFFIVVNKIVDKVQNLNKTFSFEIFLLNTDNLKSVISYAFFNKKIKTSLYTCALLCKLNL